MDNILLLLGNLVRSHNIAPDSLLRMCVSIGQTLLPTCYSPQVLANAPSHSRRRKGVKWRAESSRDGKRYRARHVCVLFVVLSSSVNRAAAESMLACHYLIKNWWLLQRGFKLFCLWVFTDWCCTNTTTTKHISYSAADTHERRRHRTSGDAHAQQDVCWWRVLFWRRGQNTLMGEKKVVALLTLHPSLSPWPFFFCADAEAPSLMWSILCKQTSESEGAYLGAIKVG